MAMLCSRRRPAFDAEEQKLKQSGTNPVDLQSDQLGRRPFHRIGLMHQPSPLVSEAISLCFPAANKVAKSFEGSGAESRQSDAIDRLQGALPEALRALSHAVEMLAAENAALRYRVDYLADRLMRVDDRLDPTGSWTSHGKDPE